MEYLSFKEAFRDARKAGDKTFTFQGKRYTTATAEENAPKKDADTGAYRGRRSEGANVAPKRDSEDIPKGSEKAPKSSGKDTSGPSNLERVLLGLPVVGGAAAAYKMYRGAKTAEEASKAMEAIRRAEGAAPILRRSGEVVEAERAATRAALAKEPPMFRSASEAEKKAGMMKEEAKKKASPRSRTEEKEDIEFRKGGMAKKPAAKKPAMKKPVMKKGKR